MTTTIRTVLAAVVLAVVAGVVTGGFLMVASPQEARLRRLDDRRVSDLHGLQTSVNLYWTRRHAVPESLDAAWREMSRTDRPVDPATSQPYGYRAIDETSYELCAVFDRTSEARPTFGDDPLWSHGAGRQCFTLSLKDLGK